MIERDAHHGARGARAEDTGRTAWRGSRAAWPNLGRDPGRPPSGGRPARVSTRTRTRTAGSVIRDVPQRERHSIPPSGSRVTVQQPSSLTPWWLLQRQTRLPGEVGPPCSYRRTWSTSHRFAGLLHPGALQDSFRTPRVLRLRDPPRLRVDGGQVAGDRVGEDPGPAGGVTGQSLPVRRPPAGARRPRSRRAHERDRSGSTRLARRGAAGWWSGVIAMRGLRAPGRLRDRAVLGADGAAASGPGPTAWTAEAQRPHRSVGATHPPGRPPAGS